jgi:hypothetical protein
LATIVDVAADGVDRQECLGLGFLLSWLWLNKCQDGDGSGRK